VGISGGIGTLKKLRPKKHLGVNPTKFVMDIEDVEQTKS